MVNSRLLMVGSIALVAAGCQTTTHPDATVRKPEPTAPTSRLIPSARGVTFATFLGGSGIDVLRDGAEGPGARLYVVGGSEAGNFPVKGGFDATFGGAGDAVIAAFSVSGQRLWASYLGAAGSDEALAIEVAPDGSLIVAGRAGPGLPVQAGFQTEFGGGNAGQDGFVCRISADGRQLYWCSYLGTDDDLAISDLAIDADGSIYLAASSESGQLPSEWFTGRMQSRRKQGRDGLLVKVAPGGWKVEWATYIGGRGEEADNPSVRVAPNGDVLFATATTSSDMPVTKLVAQSKLKGATDAWLGRFDREGKLLWGTYYGGSGADQPSNHGLAVDRFGRIYLAGSTTSRSLPGLTRGWQPTFGGLGIGPLTRGQTVRGDGFVALLGARGLTAVAATFVGGSKGDGIDGLGVDFNGVVWISGSTYSQDFAVSAGAHQQHLTGGRDGFAMALSPNLDQLVYATFLGTTADDGATSVVGRLAGGAMVVGAVSSQAFPTMSASQPMYGGNASDGVVVGIR